MAGKNALVTGGASGIGLACARLLAAEAGARILVADRNAEAAAHVAAELHGIDVVMDVGEESSVDAAVATVRSRVGPVDVLVNCAGVL